MSNLDVQVRLLIPVTNRKISVLFAERWVTTDIPATMFLSRFEIKNITSRKKDLDAKQAPKVVTQHAAVEKEDLSVALIALKDDGMPSREEMLEVMGY